MTEGELQILTCLAYHWVKPKTFILKHGKAKDRDWLLHGLVSFGERVICVKVKTELKALG